MVTKDLARCFQNKYTNFIGLTVGQESLRRLMDARLSRSVSMRLILSDHLIVSFYFPHYAIHC